MPEAASAKRGGEGVTELMPGSARGLAGLADCAGQSAGAGLERRSYSIRARPC